MNTEEFHRKLTAILSADVQGYSRLMGEDEESTVRTLTAYRTLMFSLIRDHRGHVVDSPGDNLLAKFDSGTDAVRCAVEIQEELRIRNANLPENRRMLFRIGINLGDVIEEGDRIYGDGINVAARIEGLADGGGICISGFVYGAIKNKLSLIYEFMGEHSVKNIKDPVRVYRIRMEPGSTAPIVKKKEAKLRTWQRVAVPVVVIFILGAAAIWHFSFRQTPVVSDVEDAPKTIAVLPFADLSPDSDQGYFVDGLSEELLNSLAQITDLRVTARTSSFTFKGSDKKVQEIAEELGVANILEGSVRKAGNEIRITAQLIRAVDGFHIWSKSYDRELEDIFDVQEEIATAVVDELKVTLGVDEALKQLGGTADVEAYDLYLLAGEQGLDGKSSLALKNIDAAIELDPEFALAWTCKASTHLSISRGRFSDLYDPQLEDALRAAMKAIEIEPNLAEAYFQLGEIRLTKGEFFEAALAFRKESELSNSPTGAIFDSTHLLQDVGYLKMAHKILAEERLTNPIDQELRAEYIHGLSFIGDMKGAEEEYESGKTMFGDGWFLGNILMTLARLGSGQAVSRDDIIIPSPINDAAKEYLDSPKDGLAEQHRFYNGDDYQDLENLTWIAYWAAYFGDPELSMNAIEKVIDIDAENIKHFWQPIFKAVRQLPRYKDLVKKIGLVEVWEQFGYPDLCHPADDGDFVCD